MIGSRLADLVVFCLDRHRLALPLSAVRRVVRAAEVTVLPGAPDVVCGVIDVQGEVIAVLDARARLGLPQRTVGPDDQFLIAHTPERPLALVVDAVQGVVQAAADLPATPWLGPNDTLQGLAQLPDGLVLIQDLDKFLSPAQARQLEASMEAAA